MSADLYFAFTLLVKMAVTAGFVVVATVVAERAGPVVGAMVATLPISAGPVYIFLAMDHTAPFIAQSAVASLLINGANGVFATAYTLLAQKRPLLASLAGAYFAWFICVTAIRALDWSFAGAAAMNVVVLGLCMVLTRAVRHLRMPPFHARWTDMLLRAAMVAVLVAIVVTFSFQLGAAGSGVLAVFPVVMTSIVLVMHPRMGGRAAAAVLANTPLGLLGFAGACSVLHFAAVPFGTPAGLALALLTSIAWSLLMMLFHRTPAPELT